MRITIGRPLVSNTELSVDVDVALVVLRFYTNSRLEWNCKCTLILIVRTISLVEISRKCARDEPVLRGSKMGSISAISLWVAFRTFERETVRATRDSAG